MKCNIIKDLLPSYMDELTSEDSNAAIEEHLKTCRECQDYADAMRRDMKSPVHLEKDEKELVQEIQPFKKVKRITKLAVLKTILVCSVIAALIFGLFEEYYSTGTTADSEDVRITYDKTDGVVTLGFFPKNAEDDTYFTVGTTSDSDSKDEYITIVQYHTKPWEKPIQTGGYWGYTFIDKNTILETLQVPGGVITDDQAILTDLSGDETLNIEFGDTTKRVKISDLYTEDGVKELQ